MLLATSCAASAQGWQRTDVRACHAEAPARVCVSAQPDRSVEASIGEVVLLPGECAEAPDAELKGKLEVQLRNDKGEAEQLKLKVRPQKRTRVHFGAEGLDRDALRKPDSCDAAVWPEL